MVNDGSEWLPDFIANTCQTKAIKWGPAGAQGSRNRGWGTTHRLVAIDYYMI